MRDEIAVKLADGSELTVRATFKASTDVAEMRMLAAQKVAEALQASPLVTKVRLVMPA